MEKGEWKKALKWSNSVPHATRRTFVDCNGIAMFRWGLKRFQSTNKLLRFDFQVVTDESSREKKGERCRDQEDCVGFPET